MPTTWQFGGLPPTFIGPDFGVLTVVQTDTWSKAFAPLFTIAEGPMTFSNNGDAPTGVSLNTTTGVYSAAGGMTPGTYNMKTRALGIDSPPSFTEYAWTLVINPTATPAVPVFTGPINNQITSVDGSFDTTVFATGQTSYSETGALPTGLTFVAGVYTFDVSVLGPGVFGPFETNYINAGGTVSSNPFTITVFSPNVVTPAQLQTMGRGIVRGVGSGV